MCLRICAPFVVKKARVKTNVLGFKVNSERGRAPYGSVICDYTAWLGSRFSVACTPCNLVPREAFKRENASCGAFIPPSTTPDRIIDKLFINAEQQYGKRGLATVTESSATSLFPRETKGWRHASKKCIIVTSAFFLRKSEFPS